VNSGIGNSNVRAQGSQPKRSQFGFSSPVFSSGVVMRETLQHALRYARGSTMNVKSVVFLAVTVSRP
jgi:hypothetical protein